MLSKVITNVMPKNMLINIQSILKKAMRNVYKFEINLKFVSFLQVKYWENPQFKGNNN